MTQDMKKNMILHKIGQLIVPLKRTVSPLEADSHSAPGRHFFNRSLLLLLLILTLGVTGVKAQTDYSGTYYIASDYQTPNTTNRNYDFTTLTNNFYLCPTENWISFGSTGETKDTWTTGDDKPFLTTYKARLHADTYDLTKAKWTIEYYTTESGTDYYYFKHSSGNYLVLNKQINGMQGGSPENRIRVHLETLTSEQLAVEATRNLALFTITQDGRSIYICPKTQSSYHLTVNNGNGDYLRGNGNKKGTIVSGSTTYGMEGTIGIYGNSNTDDNKYLYLEDYITRPTIAYNSSNLIEITPAQAGTITIKYTIDGSTPSATNGEMYLEPFDPADDVTTIKAIAIVGGEESNVATFKPIVYLGSTHPRLIQSQHYNNNDVTWTEPCYYMIPGDVSNGNITVNTSTLLQPTMEWYFLNAGVESDVQYYYIVNNSAKDNEDHPYYLCYDSGVLMQVFDSENANKFKFSIAPYPTTGTPTDYNLLPYGLTSGNRFINKNNGNHNDYALNLGSTNNTSVSRWKFTKKTDLNTTPPFSVSDANNIYYYKLSTNATPAAFITPPASGNYVTTNTTESTNQNWYFEQAEAATSSDWLTYYHIRNAITGEYLYYNGEVNSNQHTNAFELHSNIGSETDRYKFAMARAYKQDRWYIVPKVLKETQFANISTIWRDNNNALKTQATRNNGNAMWQFTVSIFCMPPVFTESEGNITLSCATNGAEIHYTVDGGDPSSSSDQYTTSTSLTLPAEGNMIIRAMAVTKDGETVTASSGEATLLYKPDITLSQDTYTYNGGENKPTVTAVYIGTTTANTSAYSAPTYSADVTNVGTPTVTVTDADATDTWYIMNASTAFTIEKVNLTVTAKTHSISYGDVPANDGVDYVGFVNGETVENLGDELVYSYNSADDGSGTAYTTTSPQGTYYIIPSGLTSGNYTITFVPGTLTVSPKEVVLNWSNTSPVYNGQSQVPTVTATGLVNDDVCTVTISDEQEYKNAGEYTVTATGLSNSNYALPDPATTTFEITKRPVRVISGLTANDKTYDGTTNATLVMTGAIFGEGDIITGDDLTIDSATGTFDTKDVGTNKTVTISSLNLVGDDAGNYELASSGNQTTMTASITRASLSVTANDKIIGYGDAPDNDGVLYVGFVNNETVADLGDDALIYSYNSADNGSGTAYTSTSPVGTYYIIPSGLTSGNYDITFVPGTLTVNPKAIGDGADPVEGFSISVGIGSENSFVVKNGETTLILGDDYDVNTVSTSGKYSTIQIQGKGNYANQFVIRKAKVDFSNDGQSGTEYSATFVAEGNHALPTAEGITAYIIESISGNEVIATALDYIPDGVPVLLLTDTDVKGFVVNTPTSYTAITQEQEEANKLIVASGDDGARTFASTQIYLLYYDEFVLNKAGTLDAGKVYMSNPNYSTPTPSPARLKISRGGNTGIENIEYTIKPQSDAWYTLDGRRLSSKPTKKGLYLQGGKKIVVK